MTSRIDGLPRRVGGVSSTSNASPTMAASSRRAGPLSAHAEVAGHESPGVLGHVAGAGHPDLHPAVGDVARGRPRRGIRRAPAVHDDLATGSRGEHVVEDRSPRGRHRTEPGEVDVHGQPVCRDPVLEPHGAVQGGDDDDPLVGPSTRRGVHRVEAEGVVEHAGVDLGGRRGRCGVEREVAGDLASQPGGDAEIGCGSGGFARQAQVGGHRAAGVGQLGEGPRARVRPACPGGGSTSTPTGAGR